MKQRKIPLRTCIVTKEKLEKQKLIRIVKNNQGEIFVDATGKANGRGIYIKSDIEVLNKAKKSKILDRQLEKEVPDKIYIDIENIINSKN